MDIDITKPYERIKKIITHKYPQIVMSIIIFVFVLLIANYIKNVIITYNSQDIMIGGVSSIVYYFIVGIGLLIILMNFGIEGTSIITLFASLGFAIALASQGVLGNLISGIYISLNNLFKIEDNIVITIQQRDINGVVKKMNLFNTTIVNKENEMMIVPNTIIQSNVITIKNPSNKQS